MGVDHSEISALTPGACSNMNSACFCRSWSCAACFALRCAVPALLNALFLRGKGSSLLEDDAAHQRSSSSFRGKGESRHLFDGGDDDDDAVLRRLRGGKDVQAAAPPPPSGMQRALPPPPFGVLVVRRNSALMTLAQGKRAMMMMMNELEMGNLPHSFGCD